MIRYTLDVVKHKEVRFDGEVVVQKGEGHSISGGGLIGKQRRFEKDI